MLTPIRSNPARAVEPAGLEPRVMREITANNMADHLDHARMLAFLDAYGRRFNRPLPFNWLTRCAHMARYFQTSGVKLSLDARLIERSVRAILIDAGRLGLTELTSKGSVLTPWGRQCLEVWGEGYVQVLNEATAALAAWRI